MISFSKNKFNTKTNIMSNRKPIAIPEGLTPDLLNDAARKYWQAGGKKTFADQALSQMKMAKSNKYHGLQVNFVPFAPKLQGMTTYVYLIGFADDSFLNPLFSMCCGDNKTISEKYKQMSMKDIQAKIPALKDSKIEDNICFCEEDNPEVDGNTKRSWKSIRDYLDSQKDKLDANAKSKSEVKSKSETKSSKSESKTSPPPKKKPKIINAEVKEIKPTIIDITPQVNAVEDLVRKGFEEQSLVTGTMFKELSALITNLSEAKQSQFLHSQKQTEILTATISDQHREISQLKLEIDELRKSQEQESNKLQSMVTFNESLKNDELMQRFLSFIFENLNTIQNPPLWLTYVLSLQMSNPSWKLSDFVEKLSFKNGSESITSLLPNIEHMSDTTPLHESPFNM